MTQVLILGYGEVGRAMEHLLSPGHDVSVWHRDMSTGVESLALEETARQCEVILFALPAIPHAEVAARLAGSVGQNTVVLSFAKGLDESGRTPFAILDERLGQAAHCGVVYGPMIAEDLAANRPGFCLLGMNDADRAERILNLFADSCLYLRHSVDIAGISWSAILKNAYVPLLAAAEALSYGENMRGLLATLALGELDTIIRLMGGRSGTAYSIAGLGDLVTTATSEGSFHHRIGRDLALGQGRQHLHNIRAEGIHAVRMVRHYQLFNTSDCPLLNMMSDIVVDPGDIRARLDSFLNRQFHRADGDLAAQRQDVSEE